MIGQAIAFISAFYVALVIYKKNHEYLGNKLFIISFMLFGLYAFVLFLYEFPLSILINEILLQSSLSFIVIAILFFVFSMQTFVQSSAYMKKSIVKITIIVSIAICILTFIFPYRVTQISPEIEADKNIISLLATGIWSIMLMIYNTINLYKSLNAMEEAEQSVKNRIKILFFAQIVGLLSPTMSIIGNITKNSYIHALMFIFLAVPIVLVQYAISKDKK